MVTLEVRPQVENHGETLTDRVNRQVAEIVAAEMMEEIMEPARPPAPETLSWSYSMPFAGVRYYRYGK